MLVAQQLAARKPLAIGGIFLGDQPETLPIGTTFAVSPSLALTAFHCVGDRTNPEDRHETCTVVFKGHRREARLGPFSAKLDGALLHLTEPLPTSFDFITLAAEAAPLTPYLSLGNVSALLGSVELFTADGNILNTDAAILDGVPAIQLFCRQATTLNLSGMSGAPVLISLVDGGYASVGLIRWNPEREDGIAQGNTVFASPMREFIKLWPDHLDAYLQSEEPERRGFCLCHSDEDKDMALWICEQLEKSGLEILVRGRYIVPGKNYIAEINAAHGRFPETIVVVSRYTESRRSLSHAHELDRLREWIRGQGLQVIPVRLDNSEVPDFLFGIEPIDLIDCPSAEDAARRLVNGLVTPPSLAPTSFPAHLYISRSPNPVSRSRLPEVNLLPVESTKVEATKEAPEDEGGIHPGGSGQPGGSSLDAGEESTGVSP